MCLVNVIKYTRNHYTKYKPEAAQNTSSTPDFVILSDGERKMGKRWDTVSVFVLDLSILKSGFSAAYFVRKAWQKVREFLIENAMEKSDFNSF